MIVPPGHAISNPRAACRNRLALTPATIVAKAIACLSMLCAGATGAEHDPEYLGDLGPQGPEMNTHVYGYGTSDLVAPIRVGDVGTWSFTYHVGAIGIDDGGRIWLLTNIVSDWFLQTSDPEAPNYVSARTDGDVRLVLRTDRRHAGPRPYWGGIEVTVRDGSLAPGETVTITIGDTAGGSPGAFAPAIAPSSVAEMRFAVDPLNSNNPVRVARSPLAPVEAGPAVRLEVVLPSEARPGDASWVLVKAKDSGGNAAKAYRGTVRLESDAVLEGLPRVYRFTPRDEGFHRFSVTPASASGSYRVRATDADQPRLDAASNLLTIVSDSALHPYCGDLHGQHNRGNATAEQYARFARDFGGADFMSWAVNDFHLTQANWDNINRLSALLNEPGRFVVFPGYEWSATTSRGGDHNVIYKTEGMPLLRSGYVEHDLRGYDPETDRYTVPDLLASLDPELALVMPHIGGRRADLDWFDPEFMPFIEVYSSHGQFEWFLREAIERGLPAGFVASSDDAFGKPGDSPPGASGLFAVHGGLTCVYAEALNRDALWDAFRARRVYGTTGERIQLRFRAGPQWMGEVVSDQGPVTFSVVTSGTAPIERVEIFRNLERVHVVDAADGRPADRLRIAWRGASSKERARQSLWRGTIRLSQGTIESIEPLRLDQPNERIERTGGGELAFDSVTSGDEDGVIVSLGGDYAQATLALTASLRSRNQFGAEGGGRQDVDLELPMTELLAAGATRRLDGVDQAIDIRPMGSAYPDSVAVDWTEPDAVAGHSAYWVRVTQVDGATAWSSPIFVRR